jgi:gas vesicle protein
MPVVEILMCTQRKDDIEALTNATSHLSYVEQVIETHVLDKDVREELIGRVSLIRLRLNDKNLYMAVVGGASTGKSTFINALLKQQLLESRALTMTTTASAIIQYGEQLAAKVSFYPVEDRASISKTVDLTANDEPIQIADLPGVQGLTLTEFITHITTCDEIARRLISLRISHPASFLYDGICIIDTPGADVTQLDHLQITRNAVADADAAIIITSAKQIVPDALLTMIKDELQLMPFLHRCIFLVTGMDMVRKQERDRLIQVAHQRLKLGLGIGDEQTLPPILYTAAQAVVDEISEEMPIIADATEREYWQTQFKSLEGELFSRLQQQRSLAVAEAVLLLLEELFSRLDTDLEHQWVQYKTEQADLDLAVIPDLRAFACQQHNECEDRMASLLEETLVWAEVAVGHRRDQVLEMVEEKINGTASLNELKTFVDEELSDLLTRQQQQLQKKVSERFDIMYQEAQDIRQIFDQRFTEAYQRLSAIQHNTLSSSSWKNVSLGADDLVTTANDSKALAGVAIQQRVKGAAIAMLVSAVVLPGVGLLLSAIVGSLLSGFFAPSLVDRKAQLWKDIRPKLIAQFLEVSTNVRKATRNYHEQLKSAIDGHIDEHVAQYSQAVQTMRQEQQDELARLTQRQNILKNLKKELSQRRDSVRTQMKVLNAILI